MSVPVKKGKMQEQALISISPFLFWKQHLHFFKDQILLKLPFVLNSDFSSYISMVVDISLSFVCILGGGLVWARPMIGFMAGFDP